MSNLLKRKALFGGVAVLSLSHLVRPYLDGKSRSQRACPALG